MKRITYTIETRDCVSRGAEIGEVTVSAATHGNRGEPVPVASVTIAAAGKPDKAISRAIAWISADVQARVGE